MSYNPYMSKVSLGKKQKELQSNLFWQNKKKVQKTSNNLDRQKDFRQSGNQQNKKMARQKNIKNSQFKSPADCYKITKRTSEAKTRDTIFSLKNQNQRQNLKILRRAPSSQFKKYLDNTQNIFYEQSRDVKRLSQIKKIKFHSIVIFIILGFLYIFIGKIKGYPKDQCPEHADCLVFIHCHRGYIKNNGICELDPSITNKAVQISKAIAEQLNLNSGNRECASTSDLSIFRITKSFKDIYSEFLVEDHLLKNQIANILNDKSFQKQMQIIVAYDSILSNGKKYSISCSFYLFSQTENFLYLLIILLVAIIVISLLASLLLKIVKVSQIYEQIKFAVQAEKIIKISDVQLKIEQKYGKLTKQLWTMIDQRRYKDAKITYFEENNDLYWKLLE